MLDSRTGLRLHRRMREGPTLSGRKEALRAAREARLAAALRENLRRRKEQARAQRAQREAAGAADGLSGGPLSSKSRDGGEDTAD
jgi:hypothetical protein